MDEDHVGFILRRRSSIASSAAGELRRLSIASVPEGVPLPTRPERAKGMMFALLAVFAVSPDAMLLRSMVWLPGRKLVASTPRLGLDDDRRPGYDWTMIVGRRRGYDRRLDAAATNWTTTVGRVDAAAKTFNHRLRSARRRSTPPSPNTRGALHAGIRLRQGTPRTVSVEATPRGSDRPTVDHSIRFYVFLPFRRTRSRAAANIPDAALGGARSPSPQSGMPLKLRL